MEEGSKARVDNFVQVIYGRESEVRLLLLLAIWCGRGLCKVCVTIGTRAYLYVLVTGVRVRPNVKVIRPGKM